MELEMETGFTVIWARDLQDFFNKITNQEWDYALGMDCPTQGSMSNVQIPDEEYSATATYTDFNWQRWFNGGEFFDDAYYPNAAPTERHVLQWLYENGHIPAGKYIVEVWW